MIDSLLARYTIKDERDYLRAIREIMQEIALAGLYRGGFFDKAAFYGGTALRIFHGLDRFSEDLDFSLFATDETFSLEPYFSFITREFLALGIDVDIQARHKARPSPIRSAFLKSNSAVHDLTFSSQSLPELEGQRRIRIRFEVDTDPPLGFNTESLLLLQPFSFYVTCYQIPDLFAGKLHALLYRKWKKRVKGRDWYDFEWYVRHSHPVNLIHFEERARQTGQLSIDSDLNLAVLQDLLHERIEQVDFNQARQDIAPFANDPSGLEIWSASYFHQLVRRLTENS